MRGRKPKPTSLRLMAGNPGKRAINRDEPQPDPEIPLPPAHLDAEAKAEWARMADDLFKLGLLTRIDRAALAGYCIAYSRSVKAEQMIQKTGELLKSKKTGAFYPNPYLHIANRALKQMKDFLVEFGMTPSSRSRVRATKPTAPSPKARFFQGGA